MVQLLFCFLILTQALAAAHPLDEVAVMHQGRVRPMKVYAQQLLFEFHHRNTINQMGAIDFFWQLDDEQQQAWNNYPLFWLPQAELKRQLGLDLKKDRFSHETLAAALKNSTPISQELTQLQQRIKSFSHRLDSRYQQSLQSKLKAKELSDHLENAHPLAQRLRQASPFFLSLPSANGAEWYPLKALKIEVYNPKTDKLELVKNFTRFDDASFEKIQAAYLEQNLPALGEALNEAYRALAGKPYKVAAGGKQLSYPDAHRLGAELLYADFPWMTIVVSFYVTALLFALLQLYPFDLILGMLGFATHTLVLALRCYILMRPPVSNMFETVIYVPWVAVLTSLTLYYFFRSRLPLAASTIASIALLLLLNLWDRNPNLENVQAVLDSQYWLIIHVLMIVASYGVFILSAVLGHCFLWQYCRHSPHQAKTAQMVLQTMYVGVALLIPGTILGGVWAAESWGRFWDWDPKESWAFISACIYLLVIHAYTFHKISSFGLAVGSIVGVLAISFTWYGVNYILGAGLHSYGFGSGGEVYYYLFIISEMLFVTFNCYRKFNIERKIT